MAYFNLEPFGAPQDDLRAGIIAATMANVHRGRGKKCLTAKDFFPPHQPSRGQTAEETKAKFRDVAALSIKKKGDT